MLLSHETYLADEHDVVTKERAHDDAHKERKARDNGDSCTPPGPWKQPSDSATDSQSNGATDDVERVAHGLPCRGVPEYDHGAKEHRDQQP